MAQRVSALLAIAAIAAVKLWAVDRLLARRRGSRPPEPIRMMVVVDALIEDTWRALADLPLQTVWMHEMTSMTVTTPGPLRVGTQAEAVIRILGISVADPVEVVALEPPVRYAISHTGLFKGGGVITLEAGADGTTTILRWEETLVPPVLPEVGALIGAPILRSIFQADLHHFARLVASGGVE